MPKHLTKSLHQKISLAGGKLTRLRKAILDILIQENCLVDKKTVVKKLNQKKINPDRTTLYRELLFLTKNNLVQKTLLNEKIYYELTDLSHHHHLICLICNKIKKIPLENHLQCQEKILSQKNNFDIINHNLEFYGYCYKCQKNN
ncbi:MAG TPA: transcriptional repressor [Candidatus Moranbacteria bacterium]|nr:transcriptional repressor [Candidatus Moranbacteria bacterium]